MTCVAALAHRCYSADPVDPQATPWVITPGNDQEVTKTLPNGLVITGTVVARSGNGRFAPGTPLGDSHPNAILVITDGPPGNSFTDVEFTTTVVQGPHTTVAVFDIDLQGIERLTFLDTRYRRNADLNVPLLGQPIQWNAAGENWRSFSNNNRSSELTFFEQSWGGSAGPVRMQFANSGGQSGAMFDFAGVVSPDPPQRAVLLHDCNTRTREWINTMTGAVLTPAEIDLLTDC